MRKYRGLPQWLLAVITTALLVAIIMIVSFVSKFGASPSDTQESWGQFGDFVGGILNPLFSIIGLLALLYTIVLQSEELSKSTKELKSSAKALKRQNKHNLNQKAESRFYNMLSLQHQMVQAFDLHRGGENARTIQGRDCFKDWHIKLRARYMEFRTQYDYQDTQERAVAAFGKIMETNQNDLGLYFRSLYSIFKFVEGSTHADKSLALVTRSFLSDFELVFIFYNCLSESGFKFKRFAVEYALFDNLDAGLLIAQEHIVFMDIAAYGNNSAAIKLFEKMKAAADARANRRN